jgi:hypothetical protein
MRGTPTYREMTLGDLIADSFDRAEKTGAEAGLVPHMAKRDLEAQLLIAGRTDLILGLALTERKLNQPVSARNRVASRARHSRGVMVGRNLPLTAAG